MKTGAEVGANYCVPTNECLATKQPMEIAKVGADMCRNLVRSTDGLIVRCRAAICQSNNCNDFLTRSSSRLMDCDLAQCHMESCHKTPDDEHTTAPLIVHTSGEQTTGPYSGTLNTPVTTGKPNVSGVVSVPVTEVLIDGDAVTEKKKEDEEVFVTEAEKDKEELPTTIHKEIATSLITLTHELIPTTEAIVPKEEEEEEKEVPTTPKDLPQTTGAPGSVIIVDGSINVVTERWLLSGS
eukprot:sb/3469121/